MNVIARLEYELAYYDSAVHRFNHYTTRTPITPRGHPILKVVVRKRTSLYDCSFELAYYNNKIRHVSHYFTNIPTFIFILTLLFYFSVSRLSKSTSSFSQDTFQIYMHHHHHQAELTVRNSLTLPCIRLYWPNLFVSPLDHIQCQLSAGRCKCLLVSQHWCVLMLE